jgi:geranylgeranyl pyrophosphate synthase
MILANAAGMSGMVRGQARDLGEPAPCTVEEAETLHREKTGALFRAAVELGAVAGGARPHDRQALARFGALFGLAFQHADDLADGEHVSFADTARKRVQSLTAEAIAAIEHLGAPSIPLQEIARSLV